MKLTISPTCGRVLSAEIFTVGGCGGGGGWRTVTEVLQSAVRPFSSVARTVAVYEPGARFSVRSLTVGPLPSMVPPVVDQEYVIALPVEETPCAARFTC